MSQTFESSLQSFLLVSRAQWKSARHSSTSKDVHLELEFRFGNVDRVETDCTSALTSSTVPHCTLSAERFRHLLSKCESNTLFGSHVSDEPSSAAAPRFTRVTVFRTSTASIAVRKVECLESLQIRSSTSRSGYFQTKTTINRDDSILRSEYQVRSFLCAEQTITGAVAKTLVDATCTPHTRLLSRRSFRYPDIGIVVDLTTVHDAATLAETDYEVELEVLDARAFLESLSLPGKSVNLVEPIRQIWCCLHHDSQQVFSRSEYSAMRLFMSRALMRASGAPSSVALSKMMSRPRNLKLADIQVGALVDNPRLTYQVTAKADGRRCFLVEYAGRVWLTFPVGEALVLWGSGSNNIGPLVNSSSAVFDAELVQSTTRKSCQLCLVFDTIALTMTLPSTSISSSSSSSSSVSSSSSSLSLLASVDLSRIDRESHHARSECFAFWQQQQSCSARCSIVVRAKPFYAFETLGDMSEACEAAIASCNDYDHDGLIFMPDEAPYFLQAFRQPLKARSLSSMPDVVKWKPADRLTVDLRVSGGKVYALNDVLFEGTKFGKWSGLFVTAAPDPTVVTCLPDCENVIVEFAVKLSTTRHGMYDLMVVNIRRDRLRPNSIEVVEDTWNDSIRPIDDATLFKQDGSFQLVRLAQSQQKTFAYGRMSSVVQGFAGFASVLSSSRGSCLIDIGSGRGGDLSKWSVLTSANVGTVVAIEPDVTNYVELCSRIKRSTTSSFQQQQQVIPFNLSVQDEDQIHRLLTENLIDKNKVHAVSLMLVASFLWDPSKRDLATLARLVDRVSSDQACFCLYTINGHKVRLLLDARADGSVKLGPVHISYADSTTKQRVVVRWDSSVDTILSENEQEEWLVYPEDLHPLLADYGFVLQESTSIGDCSRTAARHLSIMSSEHVALSDVGKRYCDLFDFFLYRRGACAEVIVAEKQPQQQPQPEAKPLVSSLTPAVPAAVHNTYIDCCATEVFDGYDLDGGMEVDSGNGSGDWSEEQLLCAVGDDRKRLVVMDSLDRYAAVPETNTVRIACLSKPSSFWHCLAKAICIDYRCISSSAFRFAFCSKWCVKVLQDCSASKKRFPKQLLAMGASDFDLLSVTDPHVLRSFSDMLYHVLSVRVVFVTFRSKLQSTAASQLFVTQLRALAPWSLDSLHEDRDGTPIIYLARVPTRVTYDPTNGSVVCAPGASFRFELLASEAKTFNYDGVKPIETVFVKSHPLSCRIFSH